MKREGRQHGLVATCSLSTWNSDGSSSRMVKQHQATAGTFIRVSQKPTNHSKYTSRCPRPRCPCCHTLPAGKAKDKTKGTHKLRSSDVVTNYRLVTWRVVDDDDARTGFKLSGFSASGILDHLDDYYDEEEEEDHQIYDDEYEYDGSTHHHHPPEIELMIEHHPNPNPNLNPNPLIEENIDDSASPSGDDDEISYCNVGIVWEQVDAGDEDEEEEGGGWCLVQEL